MSYFSFFSYWLASTFVLISFCGSTAIPNTVVFPKIISHTKNAIGKENQRSNNIKMRHHRQAPEDKDSNTIYEEGHEITERIEHYVDDEVYEPHETNRNGVNTDTGSTDLISIITASEYSETPLLRTNQEANNSSDDTNYWGTVGTIIGVSIVLVTILLGLLIGRRIYQSKVKRDKQSVEIALDRLLNSGDSEKINPEIPIEDQVENLPYHHKWEFPRNRINLGKQLGSGQFGVVYQALQTGTVNDPEDTRSRTVAVKTTKSTLDPYALDCLISELKIMIHLGPHLNVVNLLGACTKGIVDKSGALLVILEFCPYGNIRDYLISNKDKFVNELRNPREPKILHDYVNEQCSPSEGEKGFLIKKKSDLTNIRTSDLIYWSFQITSGMNHLASKNIIHGDLAARNVLLTEGNIVKIADFGLSRQIKHNYDIYLKKGKEALPMKWLAIESLTYKEFTTRSDVWSFGILLWELFSLGEVPYPGINNLDDLINFIQNGGRLKKPSFMPDSVSTIMKQCWEIDQKKRPKFSYLELEFGKLFGE